MPGSGVTERGSLEPYILDSIQYYPHQIEGIRTLAGWKSFILADDMGLGKSLEAITVFGLDVFRGWAETALVVCPATLKANWEDEFKKFTRIPVTVLDGGPDARSKTLAKFMAETGVRVLIVNYEQLSSIVPALNAINFHVAIFDEAHYIKNPKSGRTKAALEIKAHRNFMLTGTPLLNNVNELWPLLHKVNAEKYPEYWRFVNKFCAFGGYKDKQIVGVKNEKLLNSQLQEVMMRRLKADVLDLKTPFYVDRVVDLTLQQRKLYDRAITDMEVPRADEADPHLIDNALVELGYLRQICATTAPFIEGTDHSAKNDLAIPDAIELIENGHKIVVFSQYLPMMTSYIERMKKARPDVPIFRLDGSVPMDKRVPLVNSVGAIKGPAILVCNITVAGVGLNMTWTRYCQFLDELFVPGLNRQGVDRMNRIGQQKDEPVTVLRYIARETKDYRVAEILKTKMQVEKDVLDVTDNIDFKRDLLKLVEEAEAREAAKAA